MEKCVFFYSEIRELKDASNMKRPTWRSNGGCMKVKKIDKEKSMTLSSNRAGVMNISSGFARLPIRMVARFI